MKKIILMNIPTSICNFRCSYCYLAQRKNTYKGLQPDFKYSPKQVRDALSIQRIGGPCFINMCSAGETLLTRNIEEYIYELLSEGHFIEVVTNLTPTQKIEKLLSFDKKLVEQLEFKSSFHFLELKSHNMLQRFADNVNKIWDCGASATIEMVADDNYIPYIDEIKKFSMENFGALPHLTIPRDDRTKKIDYFTKLRVNEFVKTWSSFESPMFDFKQKFFKVPQTEKCYAGEWQVYLNLASGGALGCYGQVKLGNVLDNPNSPFPHKIVGTCNKAHCFNCHALLSMGLIPNKYQDVNYADMRDRVMTDGRHWLCDKFRNFISTKIIDDNK